MSWMTAAAAVDGRCFDSAVAAPVAGAGTQESLGTPGSDVSLQAVAAAWRRNFGAGRRAGLGQQSLDACTEAVVDMERRRSDRQVSEVDAAVVTCQAASDEGHAGGSAWLEVRQLALLVVPAAVEAADLTVLIDPAGVGEVAVAVQPASWHELPPPFVR